MAERPAAEDRSPWRPWMTYVLIGLNVAMFLLTASQSHTLGDQDPYVLRDWGAGFPKWIWEMGQYWRLFTQMWLHASLWHVGMNMYALYVLGPTAEAIYGRGRFLYLYLAGGLTGSLLSLCFAIPDQLSMGASGAVVATFGALLYFKVADPRGRLLAWRGFLINLGLMVGMGWLISGVDNWAHLGGLVGGFGSAFLVGVLPRRLSDGQAGRMPLWRLVLMAAAALALAAVVAGQVDIPGRNGQLFVAEGYKSHLRK